MKRADWRVKPAKYRGTPLSTVPKPDMVAWGCGGSILAAAILIGLVDVLKWDFSFLVVLLSCVPVAGLIWYFYLKRVEEARQRKIQQDKEGLVRRAEYRTKKAHEELQVIEMFMVSLREKLTTVDVKLSEAEHEFEGRAFGPFWDAVEEAAILLDNYREEANYMESATGEYRRLLSESRHTFPPWEQALGPVPDPTKTLRRFKAVVREGQTDFEFANIFEHRRTREVMVSGFENLGAALSGLEASVVAAVDSISRD